MIQKRPGYDSFFAENPFSSADELVFMGLVARSCHFDVTACAEARRLRGLSALWASRRASRAGWEIKKKSKSFFFLIPSEMGQGSLRSTLIQLLWHVKEVSPSYHINHQPSRINYCSVSNIDIKNIYIACHLSFIQYHLSLNTQRQRPLSM